MIVLIGAICGVETSIFMDSGESLSKSNCLLQILSHALAWKFASNSNYKQNRTRESKCFGLEVLFQ